MYKRLLLSNLLYIYPKNKSPYKLKSISIAAAMLILFNYANDYYIKLLASARISSPIASAASCVGPSE